MTEQDEPNERLRKLVQMNRAKLQIINLQAELSETKAKLAKAVDIDLIEQCIRDVLDEGGTIRSAAEYVERATLAEIKEE